MKPHSFSLKQKYLITVLGVVLAFLFSASFIWSHVYHYYLKKITASSAKNLIERTYQDFEKNVREINYYLAALDYNNEVQNILNKDINREDKERLDDRREMENILFSKLIGSTRLIDLTLISDSNEYYSSRGHERFTDQQIDDFRKLVSGQDKLVCYVEKPEEVYDTMNVVLIRQMEHCGKDAIALVTVKGKELVNGYKEKMEFPYIVLLKEKDSGQILYYYAQGTEEDLEQNFQDSVNGIQDGISEDMELSGEVYLTISMSYEEFGWQTIILIPNNEMEREYREASFITNLILILLTLGAVLVIRIIAEKYSQNIIELTDAIRKVDGTTLELDTVIESGDEVELLYHRFQEMLFRIEEQMEVIRKDEKEKKNLEIRALQAQINPHFLSNSLTTIKVMAMMNGAESIVEVTDALSAVMRVNMSGQEYVTFDQEIQYLKNYICMREYQSAFGIRFVCEVEPKLRQCCVLKLLIQPVVENAIKHGGILEKPDGRISLKIYSFCDSVKVEVRDNGIGLTGEEGRELLANLEDGSSVGLYNIQRRIELNYGPKYGIQIYGEKGSFTVVELTIPRIDEIGSNETGKEEQYVKK